MANKRFEHCKSVIRKKIGSDVLDDETLDSMMPEIAQAIQSGRYDKFKKQFIEETAEQLEWKQQRALANRRTQSSLQKSFIRHVKSGKDANEFFDSLVAGGREAGSNKNSLAINIESTSIRQKAFFTEMLEAEGMPQKEAMDKLTDPSMFGKVIEGLDKLNKKSDDFSSLDPDIRAIAKAINKSQQKLLQNLKASGIEIKNRNDYLVRQTHDNGKIGSAKPKEWVDFVHDKLDIKETFKNVIDVKEQKDILNNVYKEILEGSYGGTNASNLSSGRSLHFKDAAKFTEYHNRFGEGTLHDVLARTFKAGSKAEATFSLLGSNPRKMLESMEKFAEKNILETEGGAKLKEFQNKRASRKQLVNEVLGYADHPGESLGGKILDGLKNIQLTSKLGGAVFSTVTDLPVAAANYMAKTGQNFFSAYSDVVGKWSKSLKPSERKTIGKLLGLMADEDLNRITGEKNSDNIMGRFTKKVMDLTLLDATTRVNRTAMGAAFSNHLASLKHLGFDSLDPRLKSELSSFGITSKDWSELTSRGLDNTIDGLDLISHQSLVKNGASRNLQNKYGAFLTHNSNFGAISPDARARNFLRMGIHPDSTAGKALSALFLFKSFSVRAVGALDEIVKSNPNATNDSFLKALNNKGNMEVFGTMMASGFLAAGAGLMARDLAFGKTPRDMTKGENILEAMTRGVMPLWGEYTIDALSGSYDSFGRSLAKDAGGPAVGFIDDTAAFISSISKDLTEDRRSGKQSINRGLRLLKQNLPGTNIPLLNPAMQKLFWDGLFRANNPNYDKREEKKLKRKGHEKWF